MKLKLKGFQDDAVAKLVRYMRGAAKDSKSGDLQSVCLSSPTGSGKTVMLTRAIELVIQGDDTNKPVADATFLWITDQPELNEQTRRKMQSTSSVLNADHLHVIDASFNEETLRAGVVHFLNIQKLGKDKGLVTVSDKRTFSIWDIIKNTIDARPGKFFVIIDEAHRGMTEERDEAAAATIIQKFIKGSHGEIPPVPVVVGISATPERFTKLVGATRMHRPVDVDVAEVRGSGLIKDKIVLYHPKKEQPADMTMLREAAQSLKDFTAHWASYCAAQEEFTVMPLLVIQVEDSGAKGQLSETDIAQAMRTVRDVLGTMPSDAFAHSFQEGTTLKLGGEDIRYLAPSDIQEDADVRVVFFKTSLNTGWDCPRAEVMMSFRSAADSVYIAQLVGRMVRTPLARRIIDNEVLNTVTLYLPLYDSVGLEKIIAKLSKPDDDSGPPVDVEKGEDLAELRKVAGSEKAFEALSAIPSYIVPRRRKTNQVRRLMKLARLLTNDEIDENALTSTKAVMLGILNEEYNRLKDSPRFNEIVEQRARIEIEAVNWDVGSDAGEEGKPLTVDIAAENVEDLFEAVGRKLNEGLHKAWWRERVQDATVDREKAKLELFALCIDPDVTRKIEKAAEENVQALLSKHKTAIGKLDEGARTAYEEVKNLAASPELTTIAYSAIIYGDKEGKKWDKHLYVDEKGVFRADLKKQETELIQAEIDRKDVVGWVRNVDRKPWAFCVPYDVEGEDRPMYPDFLVVRSEDGGLVVDIVDPHSIDLADAPLKAAGLAKFAAKHADKFGRIQLIMVDGKTHKVFELTDETVRKKVKGIKLAEQMKKLFEEV